MRLVLILSLAILSGVSLAVSGCGGGQARTEGTAASATATAAKVEQAGVHLDALTQSMTNIREISMGTDLKVVYKAFANDHAAVTNDVVAINKGIEATETKARSQADEWNRQNATIQDPELRAATAKRLTELRLAVDGLIASSGQFQSVSGAYLVRTAEIKRVLDVDLTTGGIAAIKPSLTKAIDGVGSLTTSFADVSAKVKAIVDMLAAK